jgi:hypothetical protein
VWPKVWIVEKSQECSRDTPEAIQGEDIVAHAAEDDNQELFRQSGEGTVFVVVDLRRYPGVYGTLQIAQGEDHSFTFVLQPLLLPLVPLFMVLLPLVPLFIVLFSKILSHAAMSKAFDPSPESKHVGEGIPLVCYQSLLDPSRFVVSTFLI